MRKIRKTMKKRRKISENGIKFTKNVQRKNEKFIKKTGEKNLKEKT